MAQVSKMFEIQMVIFVYLLIGFISKKSGVVSKDGQQKFVPFVLNVLMPFMTFHSFRNVTLQMMRDAFLVLLISFMICVGSIYLGKIIYRKYSVEKQKIMQYATLISNAGFAGLPIASQMFGEIGLLYASVYLIPVRIFMWSAGKTILSNQKASPKDVVISLLKNPNIIAVILGLTRGLMQIQFPTFIDTAIGNISSCVSPISLIVIGAIISDVDLKTVWEKGMGLYCVVRLFAIPLITFACTSLCGFNDSIVGTTTILASMPAPTTTALLAVQYGLDETFASKLVFMTTILSIVTCPLLMLLF